MKLLLLIFILLLSSCAIRVNDSDFSANLGMPEYSEGAVHVVQGTVVGIEVTPMSESAVPRILLGYGRYIVFRSPKDAVGSITTTIGAGSAAQVKETLNVGAREDSN